ncbi:MFS transporter [Tenggerimyces flavus]|uniref:MFS transporter n=1 Tax=Tenggerimyces flavus TaxID=1708749 RepID=UPI0023BA7341|nr:MFS transporter [Tenggerimyces flavus]
MLLGIGDSVSGTFLMLYGTDAVGLSPAAAGTLLSAVSLGGMIASVVRGRWYDRAPSRLPAIVSVAGSVVGFALLTLATSSLVLLALAAVFLGASGATFPQLFTLARGHLDVAGQAERGTPALRSVWSAAWAIGPLIGGALLAWSGFTWLFVTAAATFALVAVAVWLLGPPPVGSAKKMEGRQRLPRRMVLAVIGFGLFHTAMFVGSVVLPLFVTREVDGSYGNVGLAFSVCAAVEVLAALALTFLPARWSRRRLIVLGMVLFTAHFVIIALAPNVLVVLLAQAVRGGAISLVLALGITYFQDLLPDQPGRATALLANSGAAGSLAAGIVGGSLAQAIGYRPAHLVCAAVSVVAAAVLARGLARPPDS